MPKVQWKSRTKDDLTIEVWEHLDCESVGARELAQIQQAVREAFGEGAVDSPASIARLLADEGAVLRHPEILECDIRWREKTIFGLFPADEQLSFDNLVDASESIRKLESLRNSLKERNEPNGLQRLQQMALRFKRNAELAGRSKILARKERFEAREIAQWLTIWLQEPELFENWVSLRRLSAEFIREMQQ